MTTTIYFSGSITGGREDVQLYRRIADTLEAEGHRVLAGSVTAAHVDAAGDGLEAGQIYVRDRGWLDEADLLVAEVSVPSHGVGYEIAYARFERRIPVICLWRPGRTKRCSAMIAGDPGIKVIEYTEIETALESLRQAVRYPDRLP